MSGRDDPGTPEDRDMARKRFANLAARAALLGIQLWRTDGEDGPLRFFLGRSGLIRVCSDAAEVDLLLERVAAE